jgi:hypothetical protein
MNDRETIVVTRKAEDQPTWPEKTGESIQLYAHPGKTTEKAN